MDERASLAPAPGDSDADEERVSLAPSGSDTVAPSSGSGADAARAPAAATPTSPAARVTPPAWAYAALLVSILAMSSGGLWFALQDDATPPLLKAAWRLGLTAVLQAPGFLYTAARGGEGGGALPRAFWARLAREAPAIVCIGLALGAHFGAWGWSVANTSFTHSLVLVWSTPLVLVALLGARAAVGAGPPPTRGEAAGAALGFTGVMVLLFAARDVARGSGPPVTLAGDAAAFAGGAVIIAYLEGGARLRQWVPTFVFALPVTAVASLALGGLSLALEGAVAAGTGPAALFGFAGSPRRAALALAAAAVSGILGHTAMNAAVKFVSPLVLAVAALWEPLLGSLLGYAVGLEGAPGPETAGAAVALLAGGFLVSISARDAPPLACCAPRGGELRLGALVCLLRARRGAAPPESPVDEPLRPASDAAPRAP